MPSVPAKFKAAPNVNGESLKFCLSTDSAWVFSAVKGGKIQTLAPVRYIKRHNAFSWSTIVRHSVSLLLTIRFHIKNIVEIQIKEIKRVRYLLKSLETIKPNTRRIKSFSATMTIYPDLSKLVITHTASSILTISAIKKMQTHI